MNEEKIYYLSVRNTAWGDMRPAYIDAEGREVTALGPNCELSEYDAERLWKQELKECCEFVEIFLEVLDEDGCKVIRRAYGEKPSEEDEDA